MLNYFWQNETASHSKSVVELPLNCSGCIEAFWTHDGEVCIDQNQVLLPVVISRYHQLSFLTTLNIQTIVFILILSRFWLIYPLAFFRCFMLNSGAYTEPQTEIFIQSTRVNCSNSINHDLQVPGFDMKDLKKTEGHIGWNVVCITMKMKTIFWIFSAIKIIKLHLRNLDE